VSAILRIKEKGIFGLLKTKREREEREKEKRRERKERERRERDERREGRCNDRHSICYNYAGSGGI
jgi:hypothetical protein